ncbi:putative oxidoreductase [BD1-7 clade bacterium]|uniref:Putative oxidoreductase n=1 Tax=BD1-7 clade bacterium TaxID=2029982 RepID=A0A5S9MU61_9GAMM|nr:putative oxidoreductase [BD1-7 clade bacterium]
MKTIVITGASTGIGLASVEACLKAGYKVIATARKTDDLEKLAQLGATAIALELTDKSAIETAAAEILTAADNRIDTLFNNAGYGLQIALEDTTWESLHQQHTTNVIGPICLTNALLPALSQGSKLVFNSSILGLITIPFRGPYCMSKYALEATADAYRLELESLGINVHVIEPGPIEANFRQNTLRAMKAVLADRKTRLSYDHHLQRLENPGVTKGTLPASSCADVLLDIIDGRKKGPRYLVTSIAKQAALAKRLLGSGFHRLAKANEPITLNKP